MHNKFIQYTSEQKIRESDAKLITPQDIKVLEGDGVITPSYLKEHQMSVVKGIALRGDNRSPEIMKDGHIPDKCSSITPLRHNDVSKHRYSSDCSGMVSLTIKPEVAHGFGSGYSYDHKQSYYYMYAAKFTKGMYAPECIEERGAVECVQSKNPFPNEAEVTVRPDDNEIVGYTKCIVGGVSRTCDVPYVRKDLSDVEKNQVCALLTGNATIASICDIPYCSSEDLYGIICSTFQSGLIAGVSLTALAEVLENWLREKNYTSEQIYWITQFVRGLALIGLGTSPLTAISMPVLNFLLKEYVGLSQANTNYLTTGVSLALNTLTSPVGLVRTSLTVSAGIAGSVAGSYAYNLAKKGFFAVKDAMVNASAGVTDIMIMRL